MRIHIDARADDADFGGVGPRAAVRAAAGPQVHRHLGQADGIQLGLDFGDDAGMTRSDSVMAWPQVGSAGQAMAWRRTGGKASRVDDSVFAQQRGHSRLLVARCRTDRNSAAG